MKNLLVSGAARFGAAIQHIGASLDYEVLSLPGGSLIAVALWLYASATGLVRHTAPRKRSAAERASSDAVISASQSAAPQACACGGCRCG